MLPLDLGPRPLQQFVGLDAALDQAADGPDVLLLGLADRLVLVGVDQRADALVGEDLGEQALLHGAVDDVDARHAGPRRLDRVLQLGDASPAGCRPRFFLRIVGRLVDRQRPERAAVALAAACGRTGR